MKRRITINDVAREAGVSRQTVSRAINDKGEISPETKARVMTAVKALGYQPNRLAQGMVTQRTHTVGLVLADITNPFFPEVARGVQDVALEQQYNVVLCNTDDNAKNELEILDLLLAQGVDGIILFSHSADEADIRAFADGFKPIVLINRHIDHPNINTFMVNNIRGATLAVAHLIERQHRHIGMLTNATYTLSQNRRVSGYRQAMAAHGLTVTDQHIVGEQPTLTGGYEALKQLLKQRPEITAVFTYNDLLGIGALRACRDLGLRVPEDIAIVGFDDILLASMVSPSLTSIYVNKYNIGQQAMRRLFEMIREPDKPYPAVQLDVQLIERESS